MVTVEMTVAQIALISVPYTGKSLNFLIFRICDYNTLTCECRLGFGLSDCSSSCPNFCSGNGVCNFETQQCTCNPGFAGEDCATQI